MKEGEAVAKKGEVYNNEKLKLHRNKRGNKSLYAILAGATDV